MNRKKNRLDMVQIRMANGLERMEKAAEDEERIMQTAQAQEEGRFSILRQINGEEMEFFLTKEELLTAYFLQKRTNSIEYVEAKLEDVEVDNDENLLYGMPLDEIPMHRDLIERLADTMTEIAEESDVPDWEALDEAYEKVIPDYLHEIQEKAEEELTERIHTLSEDEMREMLLHMEYDVKRKTMDEFFSRDRVEKNDKIRMRSDLELE